MEFLTNDKLVIVGAGGAIGSNMAQTALMLGLTPNICLYETVLLGEPTYERPVRADHAHTDKPS